MTYVTYTLHSPRSRLTSVGYTLGKIRPFTYDQLVVGFARSLADFMLNNNAITEPELFEALSKVSNALLSVSIQTSEENK